MDGFSFKLIHILIVFVLSSQISAQNCSQDNGLTPILSVSPLNKLLIKNDSDHWLDIKAKEDLLFICEGSEPIIWHSTDIYNLYSVKHEEYIAINDTLIGGNHRSELTIKEITSQEIGYYSCHYRRLFHQKNVKQTMLNSVYVFVTDTENLFAKEEGFQGFVNQDIAVNNSQKYICRPSSSFTHVSLWEGSGLSTDNYTELSVGTETGIQFDSRHGFHVKRIQKPRIKCVAKLDVFQEINIKEFKFVDGLHYDPVIIDFNRTFLFVGDNFTLDCQIRLSNAPALSVGWSFYDDCFQERLHKLVEGVPRTWSKHGQSDHLAVNVSVINAQLNDTGVYMCLASDSAHEVRNVTKYIQIYESPKLEMNPNYENYETELSLNFNQEFLFNVSINSVPNDMRAVTLLWTKNGYPLTHSHNERLSISRVGSQFAYLKINSTECQDSGLYGVEANLLDILFANLSLRISIKNCDSNFNYQDPKQSDDKSDLFAMIVIFVIFGSVLLFMAVFIGQKIREARRQKQEFEMLSYNLFENGQVEMINPDIPLDEQIDLLPYDKRCEFPRDNLKFGQILGQGAFGRVVRAEAYGIKNFYQSSTSLAVESTTVAVKMLKERADMSQRKALLAELKILIHVGKHMNIVNLLGAVTKDLIKGELLVIVEYCKYGNIRSYLLDNRNNFVNQLDDKNETIDENIGNIEPKYYNINDSSQNEYQNVVSITEMCQIRGRQVTTCHLINYVFQCAKGMEYLSSKKLIHRDLAARNVLLADDHIVKICDFGLARDCYNYDEYVKKGEGPLPIKWMAIESMRDKIYSEKSDVWSFGVFMWEIFTLGSNPYPGFELDEEFYNKLVDGYRMGRPQFASNSIYSLMKDCWLHQPNDRPDFSTLCTQLKQLMNETDLQKYEKQLENYSKTIDDNRPTDEYLKMNANQCQPIESYVDMSVDSTGSQRIVYQVNQNIDNKDNYPYDEVKNVRSIYVNTPVPIEPMEVVPMIQL